MWKAKNWKRITDTNNYDSNKTNIKKARSVEIKRKQEQHTKYQPLSVVGKTHYKCAHVYKVLIFIQNGFGTVKTATAATVEKILSTLKTCGIKLICFFFFVHNFRLNTVNFFFLFIIDHVRLELK